jgi:hypothetical protein
MVILISQNPDTLEGLENRLSVGIHRIQNFGRASALDRTRAQKTPTNPNGLWQSFHAQATLRTPDKPGSPPTLKSTPLSLLYKNELGSTIGG